MKPDDRERIAELLQDETRSFRSIAAEVGLSDWSVRKVARELDGDPRPMRGTHLSEHDPPGEVSALTGWLIFGGFVACTALVIWAGTRWNPPE